ncbi:hypothetical protein ACOME3_009047 [Neoechinorhynchus agilis]
MISGGRGKGDWFSRQQRIIELLTSKQLGQEKEVKELKGKLEEMARRDVVPTANVISFRPFAEGEHWKDYILQVEQHMIVSRITDADQKKVYLLSWLVSYAEICNTLLSLLGMFEHEVTARYKFGQVLMKAEQTYSEWYAELKGAAEG